MYGASVSFVTCVHACASLPAATCACAISTSAAAGGCVSHDRGNSALGSGARSERRRAPWSRRVCRIRAQRVPAPIARGAASIWREITLAGDRLFSDGGAVRRRRPSGASAPIAERIGWTHRKNGRHPPWIRRVAAGPRQQTGALLTFLRRGAYSPGVSASPIPPGMDTLRLPLQIAWS
jgi:hypothetical protein